MKLLTLDIDGLIIRAGSRERTKKGHVPSSVRRARKVLKILERDNFKCVKCGSDKKLTIDHINGRAFAKYDNHQKYRIDKCETLCEKCHIKKNKLTLKKLKGGKAKMDEETTKVAPAEVEKEEVEETQDAEETENKTEED